MVFCYIIIILEKKIYIYVHFFFSHKYIFTNSMIFSLKYFLFLCI